MAISNRNRDDKSPEGNIIGYACGPLKKPRYINLKIEKELVDFKKEVEVKFNKSPLKPFNFPLKDNSDTEDQEDNSHQLYKVEGMNNHEIKKFLIQVNEKFTLNKGRKSRGKFIENTNFL